MKDRMRDELAAPKIVDRSTFQAELDALRLREKARTRESGAGGKRDGRTLRRAGHNGRKASTIIVSTDVPLSSGLA
jgi:hypothetical protein